MRSVVLFTAAAAVCVTIAWWVAGLPGAVSMSIAGTTLEAGTPVALTLLALLFLVLYFVIRLVVGIIRLPRAIRRRRREWNRDRGDGAVNRTLTALAAQDPAAARREAERSRRLLGDTPLTLLLAAQAGRQSGRDAEAQQIFQLLADRKDGKLLGLRGLLRQAIAAEDWDAAESYARQAEAAHPGAAWLVEERKRMAVQTERWSDALRLSGPARAADPVTRAAFAVAAADAEPDPTAALRLAKQAWEAAPGLTPAALSYAGRLRAAGRERAALDVLRRTWAQAPNPAIGAAYLAPIADRLGRIRAAEELGAAAPAHSETALLLARTAADAGLTAEARQHLDRAEAAGLDDRRLHVIRAELAEHDGEAATVQEALRQLATAKPEPVWRCAACGTVHAEWHPVCDSCGTPGSIAWTTATTTTGRTPTPSPIEGFT